MKFIDPFSKQANNLTRLFDDATLRKDISQLHRLLNEVKQLIEVEDIASRAKIYYSMGTAYGDISTINTLNSEEYMSKQLYYFRKAIELTKLNELANKENTPYIDGLKLNLHTNYGNALDHCGRKIAAIAQYKKVITINNKFGMAIGNLGMAYRHYAMLVNDNTHRDYLHHFAYNLLNSAIASKDPNTHELAKTYFKTNIQSYDLDYIKYFLSKPLNIPTYKYNDKNELQYRKWALINGLFLNTLNDLSVDELYFAADVLQLTNIKGNINRVSTLYGLFNQIKQEYVSARYQFYCSQHLKDDVNFADKETCLIHLSDGSQYSIRLEMLKMSFRSLYSLLDKISYFINYYYQLGIKECDVNFHSIWLSEKLGRYGYKYNNTINSNQNYFLTAIKWISKDFYDKSISSPNPQAKRIRDIRNALEHKYVKVTKEYSFQKDLSNRKDNLAFYISEYELSHETLKLLKLIREIIISLSLAVGIEENLKQNSNKNKPILHINLTEYDDEWKI